MTSNPCGGSGNQYPPTASESPATQGDCLAPAPSHSTSSIDHDEEGAASRYFRQETEKLAIWALSPPNSVSLGPAVLLTTRRRNLANQSSTWRRSTICSAEGMAPIFMCKSVDASILLEAWACTEAISNDERAAYRSRSCPGRDEQGQQEVDANRGTLSQC